MIPVKLVHRPRRDRRLRQQFHAVGIIGHPSFFNRAARVLRALVNSVSGSRNKPSISSSRLIFIGLEFTPSESVRGGTLSRAPESKTFMTTTTVFKLAALVLLSFTSAHAQTLSSCEPSPPLPPNVKPGVNGLAFSKDGKTLVVA